MLSFPRTFKGDFTVYVKHINVIKQISSFLDCTLDLGHRILNGSLACGYDILHENVQLDLIFFGLQTFTCLD